ncbi:MAG: bifunctional 5,10-methylenetetrahydrofolate dehydrogenase/5,10-methenyltetrahydrofolate cyclohydrolase [Eubacteriales bacterium]|nr:bifunctional 5,10-methylenetetrahydrofolate dehydrogenase/5,10-methenyltetrahydrofolate cyclohydrolase [Eubacteriales bacterium]
MKELRGLPVSEAIGEEVREKAHAVEVMLGRRPYLSIIRCGEKAADIAYEKSALKKAEAFGLSAGVEAFPETVGDGMFMHAFSALNEDRAKDGILLMRPLPPQINEGFVISCMDAMKDVDGVSPVNAAGLYLGTEGFAPCTAEAVMEILKFYHIPLEGKRVVILGRSNVVGKPLALLLLAQNATVTICHSRTPEPEKICRKADILISACGKAKYVTADFIKKGAVVIDVGMDLDEDGALCGDVDFESCKKKASAMTPVPGGVGTVTTAILMRHVLEAANRDIL